MCPIISGHLQYAPTKEFCSQGGLWEQDIRCVRSVVVVKKFNRKWLKVVTKFAEVK